MSSMRSIFLIASIICSIGSLAQQSSINGLVSIFNSETYTGKRQYVPSAQVEDDFNKVQPTVTNSLGQFKLVFVKVDEKASVAFQVRKLGLQVVNIDALTAVAGQNEIIKISMANPDSITEYRRKIYNVGRTEAEKQLEKLVQSKSKQLVELKRNSELNRTKIGELQQQLVQFDEQRKKIEEQAQELTRKYAPVNLDDASQLFRQAFVLFQQGNLDAAQQLLNQANFQGKVDSILLEEKKIEQGKQDLVRRDSLKSQRKEEYAQGIILKANIHKIHYEFDSASLCYKLLIKLDSFNTKYIFQYAYFLQWLNQFDAANNYYSKVLAMLRTKMKNNQQGYEPDVATIQNNMGVLHRDRHDYTSAEVAFLDALRIRKYLAKDNPKIYEPAVASTQNNLGILYSDKRDYARAEVAFLDALEIYKCLAKDSLQVYEPDVAMTQNNLALLYYNKHDNARSEAAYLDALEIRKRLAKDNPQIYEPDVALTQNNLSILYSDKHDYARAESACLEALEIRKRLAKDNPQIYEPAVASTQNNLGLICRNKHDYVRAEAACLDALEIRKRLAKDNPQIYEPDVALTQNNIGNLYRDRHDYAKAEAAYLEALEISKRLAKNNPHFYETAVALTLNNLGTLHGDKHDYAKAEAAFLEALEIRKRLAKNNPQIYEPDVASTQNNLGVLYLLTKKYKLSETQFIGALRIRIKWMNMYPEIYTSQASQTTRVLLSLYSTTLDSLKYDAFKGANPNNIETVEGVLTNQSMIDTTIAQKLSGYYGSCSWYLLFASKFSEAEQAARKGLAVKPANTWINTNLAHSLLFQSKYREAVKIYQELNGKKDDSGKLYTSICLEDLDELEKHGIIHKEVDKARITLKEWSKKSTSSTPQ